MVKKDPETPKTSRPWLMLSVVYQNYMVIYYCWRYLTLWLQGTENSTWNWVTHFFPTLCISVLESLWEAGGGTASPMVTLGCEPFLWQIMEDIHSSHSRPVAFHLSSLPHAQRNKITRTKTNSENWTRFSSGKWKRTPETGERASSRVKFHHTALPSGFLKVLFSELEKGWGFFYWVRLFDFSVILLPFVTYIPVRWPPCKLL